MRLIDADELKKNFQDELCKGIACAECSIQVEGFCRAERWIDIAPTIEAEPLEDYRSMEQTVHKLTQALAEAEPTKHYNTESYKMTVTDFPPVEYAPIKHGHWIVISEYPKKAECSHCGYPIEHELVCWWDYCPNCGARMDEVEE